MPSNIIVNNVTTQHKMSVGVTAAFPDVCKTPAPPAPSPIPIPYPNVGNSVMAADKVTKKVSDNKQKVVVKGSSYTLTNGDQPGVALGVISNKIMGKSSIKNQSFDVKFEGKGVGRLMDPHGNNSGSNPNCVNPGEGQPPMVGSGADANKAACESLANKKIRDDKRAEAATEHGIRPEDADDFSLTCLVTGNSCSVRQGNPDCLEKIGLDFASKPKGGAGDSLSKAMAKEHGLPDECSGLVGIFDKDKNLVGIATSNKNYRDGIIPVDQIQSQSKSGGLTNWLKGEGAQTGDYDLHDIFDETGQRIRDGSPDKLPGADFGGKEGEFINTLNDTMGKTDPDTRMVQHGPQANVKEYYDNNPPAREKALKNFGEEKFERIQKPDVIDKEFIDPETGEKKTKKAKPIMHFDSNGDMYLIENEKELKDLYACKGAKYPEHWETGKSTKPATKPKS